MTRVILDTNIISELRKTRPDPTVSRWISQHDASVYYTTIINLAELRYGAQSQSDPVVSGILQVWIDTVVRPMFAGRILGVDEEAVLRWRMISRHAQIARRPTPPADLLVAAIAVQNGNTVATRDTAPFTGAGVPTINPWTGERFNGA